MAWRSGCSDLMALSHGTGWASGRLDEAGLVDLPCRHCTDGVLHTWADERERERQREREREREETRLIFDAR